MVTQDYPPLQSSSDSGTIFSCVCVSRCHLNASLTTWCWEWGPSAPIRRLKTQRSKERPQGQHSLPRLPETSREPMNSAQFPLLPARDTAQWAASQRFPPPVPTMWVQSSCPRSNTRTQWGETLPHTAGTCVPTEASASHTNPPTENQGDARKTHRTARLETQTHMWADVRASARLWGERAPTPRTFLEQAVAEEARPLQVTELPADPHVHPAEGVDVTVLLRRLLNFQLGEDAVKQALC